MNKMEEDKQTSNNDGKDHIVNIFKDELAKSDIDEIELGYYLHDGKENYERGNIFYFFYN